MFLSKMRKHNSKSNKNQRNDPEEINFWWFSNCCLFHLVSIPACRTSRSSLSCYVPHSLGGCIYHLTQRFENLTSLTSQRVIGRGFRNSFTTNFDETLQPPYLHLQDLSLISLSYFHSSLPPIFFVIKKSHPTSPSISFFFKKNVTLSWADNREWDLLDWSQRLWSNHPTNTSASPTLQQHEPGTRWRRIVHIR